MYEPVNKVSKGHDDEAGANQQANYIVSINSNRLCVRFYSKV